MKVEFTSEEVQAMALYVLDQVDTIKGFSRADKAALKRWRSEQLRLGTASMQTLTEKVNSDIARIDESAHVSAIQKPDWL